MVPHDDFTPHGYLDNPHHSWKLNPSGVLRSLPPLGMGWHMPNLGSYVRNQFQYTAHLMLGLKIHESVLVTSDDFRRQKWIRALVIHGSPLNILSSVHIMSVQEFQESNKLIAPSE